MTFLPQGRNSDYEQIDLIDSEVLSRPAVSACNSFYQSIHFEEESQPELNSDQEKEMESLQKDDVKILSLQSLAHEGLQSGHVNHEYQGLGDCKGINRQSQANAYQPLQKEKQRQLQPDYVNQSCKKKADGQLVARPQQTSQPRPLYQSLNGNIEQSMTPPPAYQSLAKGQVPAAYEEHAIPQPASYQSLQSQARPSYESLREKRKESAVQNNNYQVLEKPTYQSLHTYGNTGPKQKGVEYINAFQ